MTRSGRYEIPAIVCDADKLSQVAIIQELGRIGIPVTALAGSSRAIGYGSRYVRERVLCPVPSHDSAYAGFLLAHVRRGVIFYSNDANTENLARHAQRLRSGGFSLLIASPGCLERVIDKARLYATAGECGVLVPKCLVVSSAAELRARIDGFRMPVILKSTNLAGGIYRFIRSPEKAGAVFDEMSEVVRSEPLRHRGARLMVQQWIDEPDSVLWNFNACVNSGAILAFSMGRRIRTNVRPDGTIGSVLLFGRTEYNARVFDLNSRLMEHLGFSGIVETEWSETDGGPAYLYDFNPRPSGNIRWAFKSGVSLGEQYYRAALGLCPKPESMRPGTVYVKVFYPTNDLLESLSNRQVSWAGRFRVLRDDVAAVLRCRRHAVDVLEPRDLGPTWRAMLETALAFTGPIRRASRRVAALWHGSSLPLKQEPL